MNQSGYCFRSTYSNGNSSKFIHKTNFNWLKFALWISLLLFLFSSDKTISWLAHRLKFTDTTGLLAALESYHRIDCGAISASIAANTVVRL